MKNDHKHFNDKLLDILVECVWRKEVYILFVNEKQKREKLWRVLHLKQNKTLRKSVWKFNACLGH